MARSQMQEHIIFRWLSLKSTIEYIGEWETLYNPHSNCTEFGAIRNAAGSNNFVLSVKSWIERTNAIGIRSKAGRYGGTYAHRDLAYHFSIQIRCLVTQNIEGYYRVSQARLKRIDDASYPIRIIFDVKDWVKLETPAKYGLVKYAYRGHCKTRAEFFKHCENNPVIFS